MPGRILWEKNLSFLVYTSSWIKKNITLETEFLLDMLISFFLNFGDNRMFINIFFLSYHRLIVCNELVNIHENFLFSAVGLGGRSVAIFLYIKVPLGSTHLCEIYGHSQYSG